MHAPTAMDCMLAICLGCHIRCKPKQGFPVHDGCFTHLLRLTSLMALITCYKVWKKSLPFTLWTQNFGLYNALPSIVCDETAQHAKCMSRHAMAKALHLRCMLQGWKAVPQWGHQRGYCARCQRCSGCL